MTVLLANKCKYCTFDFDREREYGDPVACPYKALDPILDTEFHAIQRTCPSDALKFEGLQDTSCYILIDTDEANHDSYEKYADLSILENFEDIRKRFYSKKYRFGGIIIDNETT